jgi:endonuclease/exonuclease/phosphatase family metal-dependent hydrolase
MNKHLRLAYLLVITFCTVSSMAIAQQVVISELYGGGGNTGATFRNDFIELYNPSNSTISLAGWSVQYASATGTTWQVTNLSGSIAAKGFYLVQQAQGTGGTTSLPTPDAIGTIAMSGTAGKVALCNTTTALSGSNPTGTAIIDLVGFGATANGFEGAASAAPSNTTSIERKANATSNATSMGVGGIDELLGNGQDSNNNLNDFIVRSSPQPQNTSSSVEPVSTDTTPPTFTSTFPKTSNLSSSGFDLITNLNEAGKTYFVILPNNATVPTSTQVKEGKDGAGATLGAGSFGTIIVANAATDYSTNISALASATDYDVYVVAEDLIPNLQAAPVKLDVLTNTAGDVTPPAFTSSFPIVNTISATSFTVRTNLDELGKTYFVVLPSGATAPSSAQVKAGQDGSGSAVAGNLAGTINVTTSATDFISQVSGLSPSTGYDVYIVAEDNVPNLQANPTKISATTGAQYLEDFNACDGTASFTQFSVTGAQAWGCTDFGRNATKGIRMNGFAGTAQLNEDWLISPVTTLSANASLSFYSQFSFAGPSLQLKISTNYSGNGDPTAATWTDLNGNFPTVAVPSTSTSLSDWTLSNVDLSTYASQNVYIAFAYNSSTTAAARWSLDEISFNNAMASYLQAAPSSLLFTAGGTVKSYSLKGVSLLNDITINAPTNFTISKDNITFSSSISYTAAEVASSQIVYVKFEAPTGTTAMFTGSITITSLGVATKTISVRGTDKSQTLDIATYNLEFFGTDVKDTGGTEFGPIDDALQISNVTTVMQTTAADIYAVQEVADDNAFNQLLTNLPSYTGFLANRWSRSFDPPDPNFPPQKIGFVYNSATVQLVNSRVMFVQLYDDVRSGNSSLLPGYPTTGGSTPSSFWSSGRLPVMATFDATVNGVTKRLRIVVIHAKSGSAQADYDRRKYDVKVLHDSLAANYANENIILLGDYNDDVDVSIGAPTNPESTYKAFVDNSANFNTLTLAISQAGAFSFPNSNSFLDHIITSNELTNSYVSNTITVEDARTYIPNYINTTSDHLPVSARFVITPPPTVNLSVSATSGTEAGATVITVTATASSAVDGNQTVDVGVTGTGITAGDYSLSNSVITIPNGATSGSVTYTVVNDALVECTETATLNISNPSVNIVLGSTISQAVAIADDDNKVNLTVSVTGIGYEATATAITVTATATAAVSGNQTVDLIVGGTGVTSADYTLSSSTITILDGATTGTATFTVVNDTNLEGTEYPTITLTNSSSCLALGTTIKRDLIIFDNDFPAAPVGSQEIQLNFVSSYLNVGPNPGNSAEISAYDPASKRLFIVNSLAKKLNIVDFSNPAAMSNIATIDITPYGGINSVAVKNGIVATAIEGTVTTDNGSVVFFDKDGTFLKQVAVGAMPDMITFSPNGNFVLTANEGEPNDAYTIDPEGTVSIIDISGGVANLSQSNVTTANFNAFDSQLATLRTQGVRVYGVNATVSKDFEPEYIAFSSDGNTAYVTLQENNAIGVLDMATKTITAVRPLGLKDHNLIKNGLDASDQSGVVNISNLPVKGMYQPDAIAGFALNGTSYLITANEGDSRAYTGLNEEVRVGAAGYVLDPIVFPNAALLKSNNVLGRLQLTNKTGDTDGDGDFDEIHALGARSFSIWKPTSTGLEQVFDSGDQLERITAADTKYASIFNASNDNATPSLKNRSDNKGPEPEGVTVATIDGKIYAFIALERTGGVMAFNITDPANPVFVQWINSRNLTAPFGDLGAEGIFFISAKDSPTGIPLVVLSNEISSTISVFSIGGGTLPAAPGSLTAVASSTQAAATVNWTDNASNEIGFEIQRSTNASSSFSVIGTALPNATSYVDNSVAEATTYFYKVKSFNDFGFSAESNTASVTIKQSQTITFPSIADKQFGDAPFTFTLPTSTSGLTVTVTPNPKVTINGNQITVVSAGKASITASQAGNTNYNAATSVTREFCIRPAKPSVTVTLASGIATLTSNAASGNQWYLNGAIIAGATNSTYTATTAGTYKVQVTIDNCISDFSTDTPVIITGDLPIGNASIGIYPNPTTGSLYITGLEPETKECVIIDLLGRSVQMSLEKVGDQHRLTTDGMVEGVYTLRVVGQRTSVQQLRFIKRN